jgi:hypothetical protein
MVQLPRNAHSAVVCNWPAQTFFLEALKRQDLPFDIADPTTGELNVRSKCVRAFLFPVKKRQGESAATAFADLSDTKEKEITTKTATDHPVTFDDSNRLRLRKRQKTNPSTTAIESTTLPESDAAVTAAVGTTTNEESDAAAVGTTTMPESDDTTMPESDDTTMPESDAAVNCAVCTATMSESDATMPESDAAVTAAVGTTTNEESDTGPTTIEESDAAVTAAVCTATMSESDATMPESDAAVTAAVGTTTNEESDTGTTTIEESDAAVTAAVGTASIPESDDTAMEESDLAVTAAVGTATMPESDATTMPESDAAAFGTTIIEESDVESEASDSRTVILYACNTTSTEISDQDIDNTESQDLGDMVGSQDKGFDLNEPLVIQSTETDSSQDTCSQESGNVEQRPVQVDYALWAATLGAEYAGPVYTTVARPVPVTRIVPGGEEYITHHEKMTFASVALRGSGIVRGELGLYTTQKETAGACLGEYVGRAWHIRTAEHHAKHGDYRYLRNVRSEGMVFNAKVDKEFTLQWYVKNNFVAQFGNTRLTGKNNAKLVEIYDPRMAARPHRGVRLLATRIFLFAKEAMDAGTEISYAYDADHISKIKTDLQERASAAGLV